MKHLSPPPPPLTAGAAALAVLTLFSGVGWAQEWLGDNNEPGVVCERKIYTHDVPYAANNGLIDLDNYTCNRPHAGPNGERLRGAPTMDGYKLCLAHAVAVGRPAHNHCYRHLAPHMQRTFVSMCRNTQFCNGRDDPSDGLRNCMLAIHNGGDGTSNKRSPYWKAIYRKCGTCERVPGGFGFSCRHTIPVPENEAPNEQDLLAFKNKPAAQWQRECDYIGYAVWDNNGLADGGIVRYYDPSHAGGGCEQDRNGDGVYEIYQPSATAPNSALCTYSHCGRDP